MEHFIEFLLVIIVVFGLPAVISIYSNRAGKETKARKYFLLDENVPVELRKGILFLNEQDIECNEPVLCKGRADQVFLYNNHLVVVDTKKRKGHYVYERDIMQLSIYGYILSKTQKYPVQTKGYIRTVVDIENGGKSVCYHAVSIAPQKDIVSFLKEFPLNT